MELAGGATQGSSVEEAGTLEAFHPFREMGQSGYRLRPEPFPLLGGGDGSLDADGEEGWVVQSEASEHEGGLDQVALWIVGRW